MKYVSNTKTSQVSTPKLKVTSFTQTMLPNTRGPSKPTPFSVQLFPWIYISSLKPPLNIETEIGNRCGGGVESSPLDHHHLVDCCGGGGGSSPTKDEKFRPINCNRNKLQKRLLRSRFSLCVFGWNFARSELILAPVELRCVGGTLRRGRLGHTHPQPVSYGKSKSWTWSWWSTRHKTISLLKLGALDVFAKSNCKVEMNSSGARFFSLSSKR